MSRKMALTGAFLSLLFILLSTGLPFPLKETSAETHVKYFEGDINLPSGFEIKSGIIGDEYRWPNATVLIEIDEKFGLWGALELMSLLFEIQLKTCVIFSVRQNETDAEEDYVFFQLGENGSGCYSSVGKQGGRQLINLDPECITNNLGVIKHLVLHTLGFFHEQSRTDRDEYVDIIWENVVPGMESNFEKYSSEQIDDYRVPYDYGSIMHFDRFAFALNTSLPTIVPKRDAEIGQRTELSKADALKIRRMYNIPDEMEC